MTDWPYSGRELAAYEDWAEQRFGPAAAPSREIVEHAGESRIDEKEKQNGNRKA